MKDIVRRKALQSAPRSGRIFASEGALGDWWAVCGVVKSTARACPYGRLGQTTKPARGRTRHACQSAQQSSGYTPRKINGTTRAERCTDASPARQARINSPEQSLKHRCQAVPGRLNRPAVLEQCPRHIGWAALSFDPAGRTVTRSQLLFAPDTWSTLSWRQRSHCVQHTPWLVSSAMPLVSSTVAVRSPRSRLCRSK